MRLPRGYKVTGAVYEDPERPNVPATRWRAYHGEKLIGDCYGPEEAVLSARTHAATQWATIASKAGFSVSSLVHDDGYQPAGDQLLRADDEAGDRSPAHCIIFDTGKVCFGGKTGARQRLATELHELGLLRGCDRKAQGGEWDLPPAQATFGEAAIVGHTYTRADGLRIDVTRIKAGLVWGRCYIVSDGSTMTARQPGVDAGTPAAQWAHLGRTEAQVRP